MGCKGTERVSGRYRRLFQRGNWVLNYSARRILSVSPKEQDRYSGEENAGKWFPRFTAVLLLFAVLLFLRCSSAAQDLWASNCSRTPAIDNPYREMFPKNTPFLLPLTSKLGTNFSLRCNSRERRSGWKFRAI